MYLPPPSTLLPSSTVDVYVRDSGGSRQEQSTDQQLRSIQTYCAQYGLQLRHRFVDEAKSGGTTAGRDEFNRMMSLYENESQRPHALLLWNYARFARDIDDAQLNKIVIRKWGILIHSLNDSVPEGDYGRFIEFFIDMSNEEKRKQTSIDSKRGLRELVERYGCVPGTPPRGFLRQRLHIGTHRDGSPRYAHKWIPDPDLAPLILQAFTLRAAGASLGQIQKATHLYSSINSYVTFWSNTFYIGTLHFGDLIIENYCEPIVPRELWDKVQEIQKHHVRWKSEPGSISHPRRVNSRFLLSGLARCGLCGSPLYGHSSKQRGKKTLDSYYCSGAWRKRNCSRRRIPRLLLEDKVVSLLRDVILQPANLAAVRQALTADQAARLAAQTRQRSTLNVQLIKTRRQLANVTDAIAEQRHSPALLKRLTELEALESSLLQQQSDLALTELHPLPEITPAQHQRILNNLQTILATGTHEQKQTILRGLIDHLEVRREPDGLHGTLWYYYPPNTVPTPPIPSGPPLRRHSILLPFFVSTKHPRH